MSLQVSFSSLKTFMECPKKYYFRYIKRRDTVVANEFLESGSAFHEAIEHSDPARVISYDSLGPELKAGLIALAGNYPKIAGDLQHEVPLEVDLSGDVTMVGHVDATGIDEQAQQFFVETKSTRSDISEGSPYWERIRGINPQADTYFGLLRLAGYSPAYCVWDACRVPIIRRFKATPEYRREFYKRATETAAVGDPRPGTILEDETFDDFTRRVQDTVSQNMATYYRREIIVPDEVAIADTMEQNLMVSQLLVEAIDRGRFACNKSACYANPRSPCEFVPVCSGKDTIDNPALYRIRPVRPPKVEETTL